MRHSVPFRLSYRGERQPYPDISEAARARAELRSRIEDIHDDRALTESIDWYGDGSRLRPKQTPRRWTFAEDLAIRRILARGHVPSGTWTRLAAELDRSPGAVRFRVQQIRREPF